LIPDADEAGRKAALVGGALLVGAGMEVAVADLPEGLDPDGVIGEFGRDKMAAIIDAAMDYFGYLKYIINMQPLSLLQKEDLAARIASAVAALAPPLRLKLALAEVAAVFGVDPESLAEKASRKGPGQERHPAPAGEPDRRVELEKLLLRLLLEDPRGAEDTLDPEDFSSETCRALYKLLDSAAGRNIDLKSTEFHKMAEQAGLSTLAAEIALITLPPGNPRQLLRDTVRRVKSLRLREELDVLKEELKRLPEGSEEAVAVAEYFVRLKKALSEL